MKVFSHHIYEYRKGLRNLVLHTVSGPYRHSVEAKLNKMGIAYQVYTTGNGDVNVFFGAKECVDVIKAIGKSSLADYTPEEDFILGTMLGYGHLQQCLRYLGHISNEKYDLTDEALDLPDCNPIKEIACEFAGLSKMKKESA